MMDIEDSSQNMQKYQLIESNCEYLSSIRRNAILSHEKYRNNLPQLNKYFQNQKCKLNHEMFIQLLIELGYFIYSCRHYKTKPIIEKEDFRIVETYIKPNEKRFNILVFYKVSSDTFGEGEAITSYLSYLDYIFNQMGPYLQKREDFSNSDNQLSQIIDLFQKQLQVLKDIPQTYFFQLLQQTNLFYEFSMLLKIKNCSIMDLIKSDKNNYNKFAQCNHADKKLVDAYNKDKLKNRNDQQTLRNKEKQIDENIKKFFGEINPIKIEYLPNKNEKEQSYKVKFTCLVSERPKYDFDQIIEAYKVKKSLPVHTHQNLRLAQTKRSPVQMEYLIEYSSQRNSICVKLIMPNIYVNVETSDFLMYQSNILTFQAVNVSIELCESKLNKTDKNSQKVLAFKGASCFNTKQPPLQKILLLMDITMISSRIYEPELNPNRTSQPYAKDHLKIANISKKINHYSRIFLKCAKKVYGNN